MPVTPNSDPSWVELLEGKSFTHTTTQPESVVKADGYFTGVSKGDVIKVFTKNGTTDVVFTLLAISSGASIKTEVLNPLGSGPISAGMERLAA